MTKQKRTIRKKIGPHTLYKGDCVDVMRSLDADSFDVCLTDPPYSSAVGGTAASRSTTSAKYTSTDAKRQFPEFHGDHRDQRGFQLWCSIWMTEAYRLTRPGGAMVTFTDWRNIACVIDSVQAGGWSYDGIVPWIKKRGRPRLGWFQTSQSEFAVVARKGKTPRTQRKCGPKAVNASPPTLRIHPTQKPTEILLELIRFRSDWSRILDPFAGGGSTVVAGHELGRQVTAIEYSDEYFRVAGSRIAEAIKTTPAGTDAPA